MRHLPFQRFLLLPVILMAWQACTSNSDAENKLQGQLSFYLRQYSEDQINWRPWQSATFTEGTQRNKIIFASIGYSACHSCWLMRQENFKDPGIIDLLNREFVCAKIDRLERPDLDLAFRIYAQTTGLPASWPLHIWLTPAGNPMAAGSFSPTKPGSGSIRFKTILSNIAGRWKKEPNYINTQSAGNLKEIREHLKRKTAAEFPDPDPDAARLMFFSAVSASYDPRYGGFDRFFKFPRPETLEAIARLSQREPKNSYRARQCRKMLTVTLDGMLAGAIIDPINGGIFRYTNDNAWRLPQFEKMSADQARICSAFLTAYQISGDKRYAKAARDILEFVKKNLTGADGSFYTSLASHGSVDDPQSSLGTYYLWHKDELAKILDANETAAFCAAFGIREGGNICFPGRLDNIDREANIPFANHPEARSPKPGSPLESAIRKVIGSNSHRSPPPRNEMIIAGWNGIAISSFAKAGAIFGDPAYIETARSAARQVLAKLFNTEENKLARGRIGQEVFGSGFCEDYIYLARGLLDLYRATADIEFYKMARKIQSIADQQFLDPHSGLYHLTPAAKIAKSPFGLWVITDGDLPSINGIAALNLLEIAAIEGSLAARQRAMNVIRSSTPEHTLSPSSCGSLMLAIDQATSPALQAIISGVPSDPLTQELATRIRQSAPGNITLIFMDGKKGQETLLSAQPELAPFRAIAGNPKVFLCEDYRPQTVVTTPELANRHIQALIRND
ncbi:MAG: DUF255 domain-containing protein [Verrucomicrobiales bacterium]